MKYNTQYNMYDMYDMYDMYVMYDMDDMYDTFDMFDMFYMGVRCSSPFIGTDPRIRPSLLTRNGPASRSVLRPFSAAVLLPGPPRTTRRRERIA